MEKCWYPAVIKIDKKGRNLNWWNTKSMRIDETNRNLKFITMFIKFVCCQLRFMPFPSSFITVGHRHVSSILIFRQVSWIFTNFNVLGCARIDEHCKTVIIIHKNCGKLLTADKKCWACVKNAPKLMNFIQNWWTICQNRAALPRNLQVSQANSHWEHLKRTWKLMTVRNMR